MGTLATKVDLVRSVVVVGAVEVVGAWLRGERGWLLVLDDLRSAADAAELDSYIHVSNLLAVMQSKARRSLLTPDE